MRGICDNANRQSKSIVVEHLSDSLERDSISPEPYKRVRRSNSPDFEFSQNPRLHSEPGLLHDPDFSDDSLLGNVEEPAFSVQKTAFKSIPQVRQRLF